MPKCHRLFRNLAAAAAILAPLGLSAAPAQASPEHPIEIADVDASEVGREHLRDTVAELLQSSELISSAVAEGRLAIVGANYRLQEGRAVPDIVVGLV